MAKRINISVSDELFEKLETAKNNFPDEIKLSKICQTALKNAVEKTEAFLEYRKAGFSDGKKDFAKIPDGAVKIVCSAMESYDSLTSENEKTAVLQTIESELYKAGYKNYFFDRFSKLFNGEEVLHKWVKNDERRGEACWFYTEGWYFGISNICKDRNDGE